MDSEKLLEVEHKIETGKSLTDEGPYYHHTWWESYKGASKGELGGTIIGGILGAVVGLVVAAVAAMASTTLAFPAIAIPTVLAFSAGGIFYGVHKFSNVGAVSGAIASSAHQGENRMRAFEEGKFDELKQEIGELKALVKGTPPPVHKGITAKDIEEDLDDYRSTHYAKIKAPLKNRLAFWKISLMGLIVGAAAGAVLAGATGGGAHLLQAMGMEHLIESMGMGSKLGGYIVTMMAVGTLGASFGINRDVFRKIFDKTDLWFKGAFGSKQHDIVEAKQEAIGKAIEKSLNSRDGHELAVKIVTPEGTVDYPESSTFHRDRLAAAAEKSLLHFDHTRATPQ